MLEGESGLNDPVAIVLVIGFIDVIQKPDYGVLDMVWLGVTELAIGAVVGLAVGRGAALALQRVSFGTTGLYPVASIAAAGISFGAADVLHGSGFLAVYLTGLVLGSVQLPARRTVADFHDALAWVSQIAVFFTLGLLVFPSEFGDIIGEALLVAAVLMFVARPVAVYLCTLPARFTLRESTLLGWARPARRGADRARHLPGDRGRPERGLVLQHRLLRRAHLDADPGRDLRAAGARAEADDRTAGDPAAAGRGRHDPTARARR